MADHRTQVEELLADYRRSREQLASVHQELAAITECAASHDGSVTATVGARGQLVDLVLTDAAYQRYRPADLARVVVATAAAAAARAAAAAGRTIQPLLPVDADPDALLAGTADLAPAEIAPRPPAIADGAELEESFENQSWLEHGEPRRAAR